MAKERRRWRIAMAIYVLWVVVLATMVLTSSRPPHAAGQATGVSGANR
jgi:hypothetical protein